MKNGIQAVLSWSLYSIAGIAASVSVAGLVPRIVHADSHEMFETTDAVDSADGRWNGINDPRRYEAGYEYRLDKLPTDGKVESHMPWSDTYWPSNRAGIAARWNWKGAASGFKYGLYSEKQIRGMTPAQIAMLSPAEKYDIFMGRFDYPTVKSVRRNTSSGAADWAGICNGWAPAALNHAEPQPVSVVGPSGVEVPFGSADVKGLMDQYYANNADATQFLGGRCRRGGFLGIFASKANCYDVNAGALHVVLSNELGIQHKGFVADVDRGKEVWNQPVYGYSSKMIGTRRPSKDAAVGTVKEVLVHTEMYYTDEIEATWETVVGTAKAKVDKATYDYALELDAEGRILGGSYYLASNPEHPDFLWNAPKLQFTGYYEGINRIYRSAQQ